MQYNNENRFLTVMSNMEKRDTFYIIWNSKTYKN